ncbi:MAG: alpha/beta hydrolase [Alphaproteobacteria bacterium]
MTGCAPLGLLDQIVPAGNYDRQQDIAYGVLERQKLDVYRPADDDGTQPVVIFLYGGSWKSGAREKYRFVAEALTRKGLTVVIPDYRLYPDVTFPAFMHDAARAVRWTLDNLAGDRGMKRPVFLAGHSAGAHIAALMTVDDRYYKDAGVPPSRICGVIGVAGPYAFDPLEYRSTRAVFAGLTNPDTARPARLVTRKTPPFLLIHGNNDDTVRLSNTREFATALSRVGTDVRTEFLDGIGHYQIVLAMASPFDDIAPVNARIATFIERHRNCPTR